MHSTPKTAAGFTLLELSIVLAIIGLLVGGIVMGKSMIRGAVLQSVVTDFTKYRTAASDFKKQYGALPGDMIDGPDYWGLDSSCGGSVSGVCKGNGDGLLNPPATSGANGETFQFWKELALAGSISGKYSGLAGAGNRIQSTGDNTPPSRITNTLWEAGGPDDIGLVIASQPIYNLDYGNYLKLGGMTASAPAVTPLLKPEEAMKIDSKIDDGYPGRGTVIASHWSSCTNSASNTDFAAPYKVADTGIRCMLYFVQLY